MGFIVAFTLPFITCSGESAQESWAQNEPSEDLIVTCEASAQVKNGIYTYDNNVWGADENLPWRQCILKKEEDGKTIYGWYWQWEGRAPNWVFSYPEIIVGWKPWGPQAPTHEAYPAKVKDIESLTITYDVSIDAYGQYNLAPEIWLISEKPESYPIEKPEQLITTEIMFWMDYTDSIQPAGSKVGELEFNGVSYDLWLREDHNNSGDTVSWTVYSLVSPKKQLSGTIDVIGLINTLAENGYDIDTEEYVATVEFGNEVMGISENSRCEGTTWVNDYSVDITLK